MEQTITPFYLEKRLDNVQQDQPVRKHKIKEILNTSAETKKFPLIPRWNLPPRTPQFSSNRTKRKTKLPEFVIEYLDENLKAPRRLSSTIRPPLYQKPSDSSLSQNEKRPKTKSVAKPRRHRAKKSQEQINDSDKAIQVVRHQRSYERDLKAHWILNKRNTGEDRRGERKNETAGSIDRILTRRNDNFKSNEEIEETFEKERRGGTGQKAETGEMGGMSGIGGVGGMGGMGGIGGIGGEEEREMEEDREKEVAPICLEYSANTYGQKLDRTLQIFESTTREFNL